MIVPHYKKKCQLDFDNLNEYTDYSSQLFSYQSSLLSSKHTYDVWTSTKSNCQKYGNYEYINNKNGRKILHGN